MSVKETVLDIIDTVRNRNDTCQYTAGLIEGFVKLIDDESFPVSDGGKQCACASWIPVEEKLPEKNMECLIHTKTGCIEIARFGRFKTASGQENILFHIETVEGWDTVDWKGNYGISHWQPLPNPPKKRSE